MRWELVPVRTRLGRLLRKGTSCGDPKAEAMCRNLLKLWPALLTFAFVPGVEPTNNRAERALRAAVLWRKGCFGNQSGNGSRFTERILTTVATLRQLDRNIVGICRCGYHISSDWPTRPASIARVIITPRGGLNDYIKSTINIGILELSRLIQATLMERRSLWEFICPKKRPPSSFDNQIPLFNFCAGH